MRSTLLEERIRRDEEIRIRRDELEKMFNRHLCLLSSRMCWGYIFQWPLRKIKATVSNLGLITGWCILQALCESFFSAWICCNYYVLRITMSVFMSVLKSSLKKRKSSAFPVPYHTSRVIISNLELLGGVSHCTL